MDQFKTLNAGGMAAAPGVGRRIYAMLRSQIADGTLPPGARLPSTRVLAAELGVSRTTVTAAYEQLAAEGFVLTAAGRAARVAQAASPPAAPARKTAAAQPMPPLSRFGRWAAQIQAPALSPAESVRIDFRYGALAAGDFPTLAWRRAYQAALLRRQTSLYYAAPEGEPALRQALQGYLRRARGIVCDAGQIMVTHGSQQAIDLCARLLLDADDAFVFENPGYLMARHCFAATGARLLPVPVDDHGVDTARLPVDERIRLAYVTPSHQFPLGGVLPISRRLALLDWARRQRAWIVEDDYDGEFRYGQRPIDALRAVDADDRVIYVGTFSKALSPQLRLGYIVLPQALAPVFQQARRLTDRHSPMLDQQVLAALIGSGAYERHVRRMRRENERRRTALLDAIDRHLPGDARVDGTAAGLHVVLWLPGLDAAAEPALLEAARLRGVGVYPATPLYAETPVGSHGRGCSPPRHAGLILGYASLGVEQICAGIAALAGAIAGMATPGQAAARHAPAVPC